MSRIHPQQSHALPPPHADDRRPPYVPFTIRDVLWLTVVALALGWWVDNKRIEKAGKRVEEVQADFEDRMTVFDEVQKDAAKGLLPGPGIVKARAEAAAAARTAKESATDNN